MKSTVHFSIIVPVYNTEKYLEDCICSIVYQKNFELAELILINDGSIDNSESICRKYMKQFNNIKYFKQENQGLSSARNVGLEKAIGNYIVFVDSDDILVNSALEILTEITDVSDIDIITIGFKKCDENGKNITYEFLPQISSSIYSGSDLLNKWKKVNVTACGYVYSKKFLNNNNIRFKVGILHEDNLWAITWILSAKKILDSNEYLYIRRTTSNSISRSINIKKSYDLLTIAMSIETLAIQYKNKVKEITYKNLLNYTSYITYSSLCSCVENNCELSCFYIENKNIIDKYLFRSNRYFFINLLLKLKQYTILKKIITKSFR